MRVRLGVWMAVLLAAAAPLGVAAQPGAAETHVKSGSPGQSGPDPAINWAPYQDEAVRLLQEYLRIDTSNPPGHEIKAAEFFHHLFDEAHIPNTTYPYAPDRANISAVLKGDGSLRPIVLLSHMDVVRAQPQNWKSPPFAADIVDGDIYARGALDMKDEGLLEAMTLLIAAREHLPLKRDLIFLATADEEVGDTGSEWMLKNHPEVLDHAEYLITEGGSNLTDPKRGSIYGIGVAEKAPYWLRLTATGRGGHGSIPIADSAPDRLVRALSRVVAWQPPVRPLPSVEEYFQQLASLESEPTASEFRHVRESLRDPAFLKRVTDDPELNYQLRDTVSLTMLQGSQQTNVIPDRASAQLDVRLLPGEDPQEFLRQLRSVIDDDGIEIESISPFRKPNSSSTDTLLYRTIADVVREFSPHALVVPVLNSGYTESQMYRPLGISCYGFTPVEVPPEVEATEHAANERVPVEEIRRGLKMLYEIVGRTANP